MSADTNWYNHHHSELEKLQIEAWLKLPSFFLQDGRIRSPHYLEFLKKETKNFEKEMCGNWDHENEMPKMTMGIATIGSGSATSKQRFPDFELDALADDFLLDIEENRLPYESRKEKGIHKQIEDMLFPFSIELIEPVNLREKVEQIAKQMPPFVKPKPKKKAKVSDFKKRINSFLRKK